MSRRTSPEDSEVMGIATRQLKRRSTETSLLPFFTPSSETFHPQPYLPQTYGSGTSRTSSQSKAEIISHVLKPMDPVPGDGSAIFIRAPFDSFPNAQFYPEGLSFTLLSENPEWFLDARDFKGETPDQEVHAITYPQSLEPPRGWCPTKKKDNRYSGDGIGEDTPTLRCTFCRRKYAGVNAKSMWRRHVLEKHKVPMANRREGPIETTRMGRSSNKENRGLRRPVAATGLPRSVSCGTLSTARPMQPLLPPFERSGSSSNFLFKQDSSSGFNFPSVTFNEDGSYTAYDTVSPEVHESLLPSTTSPVAMPAPEPRKPPVLSSSNGTRTPLKRDRKNKIRLPWKFPDPRHPLYSSPDDLLLGVPVSGIAGEGLEGAYVPVQSSPYNFSSKLGSPNRPATSPPTSSPSSARMLTGKVLGWKRSSSENLWTTLPALPSPARRPLHYTGPLPVPVNDRLEIEKPDLVADGFSGDEFDASISTIEDPFSSWFDIDGVSQSPLKNLMRGSSATGLPDSPIKRSEAQRLREPDSLLTGRASSSWALQPSGFGLGLGIVLPSYAKGNSEENHVQASLSTFNVTGETWDNVGELQYPTEEVLEGPEDSPTDNDLLDFESYDFADPPPMKRRKTIC